MIANKFFMTIRSSLLLAGVALSLLSAGSAHAELLTNGGFETGDLTGWNVSGSAVVQAPAFGAQAGSNALLLNNPTADGVAEVNQGAFGSSNVIAASAGDEFNLSGWMYTEAALPAGATFGLFKIVFEDAAGVDLEPASISIGQAGPAANPGAEALPFLNNTSTVGEWIFSQTQAVAPENTASVQFLALNVDFGNGFNHPMWVDSVSAVSIPVAIPEPSSFAFLAIVGAGGIAVRRRRRQQA
jgi:hypothetical protein